MSKVMLRLKSAIFVQALIRRCETAGAAAYLLRRGAEEAGAVFIKLNRRVWTPPGHDDGVITMLAVARKDLDIVGLATWLRTHTT